VRRHEPNPTPTALVKIAGPLQELEETEYWLELLRESGFFPQDGLAAVRKETGELKGIFVSIVINTKAKSKPPKSS
jgi:four helix bundle protein